jgi:hypothetical protein
VKRTICSISAGAVLAFVVASSAEAQKPGGGESAGKVGDNIADLISDNLGPLLIVLIGAVGIGAFMARSMGQLVMIVLGGLFAGVFIIEPAAAESLFKSVYDAIF